VSTAETMLIIRPAEYESLRQHGEESYPHECCGALLGIFRERDRVVQQSVRCGNTRTDRPQDRYNIAPQELIGIQREASRQGLEIVGFYHSHPDHPAQWSQTDLAEAHWLGCSYVITAVEKGSATLTNSFVLEGESEDDKCFQNEPISLAVQMEDQSLCR
jgi:proteasome lid subunit RPN8/RPN11